MRFVDLFAGLGGFRVALERLGHECVFACEIDPQLQELYGLTATSLTGRESTVTFVQLRNTYLLTMCFAPGFHVSPSPSRGLRLA